MCAVHIILKEKNKKTTSCRIIKKKKEPIAIKTMKPFIVSPTVNIVLTTLLLLRTVSAIQWLALSRASSVAAGGTALLGTPSICDQLADTLDAKQVQFCKKHPGFMVSVQTGASRAIDECKFQFRTRRWNCSTLDDDQPGGASGNGKLPTSIVPLPPATTKKKNSKNKGKMAANKDSSYGNGTQVQSDGPYQAITPPFNKPRKGGAASTAVASSPFGSNPVVPGGTREAAFVHAISAAGVAHALTRACSAGELDDCGCDRTVRGASPEGFQWAGCSDNVHFGTSFSRTFVDAREHRFSKRKFKNAAALAAANMTSLEKANQQHQQQMQVWRALMNLHNNEAGRKIIEKSMRIECKCHGVSGSCELRTCWKAMPSFREIGEQLKEKFDSATEVEPRTSHSGSRRHLVPRSPTYKPHTEADLVYLDRSPDYCEYDSKTGSLGTHGRPCNKTSKAIDGCDLLCCNRGYKSTRERRAERCMCKFHWCCSVHCKTCLREIEVHTCM